MKPKQNSPNIDWKLKWSLLWNFPAAEKPPFCVTALEEGNWGKNWVSRDFSHTCCALLDKAADFPEASPGLWVMTDECHKPGVYIFKGHPCYFAHSTPKWAPRCGIKAALSCWQCWSSSQGRVGESSKSLGHSTSGATSTNQQSSFPFDPHLLLPLFHFSSCLRFTAALSKYITGNKG